MTNLKFSDQYRIGKWNFNNINLFVKFFFLYLDKSVIEKEPGGTITGFIYSIKFDLFLLYPQNKNTKKWLIF